MNAPSPSLIPGATTTADYLETVRLIQNIDHRIAQALNVELDHHDVALEPAQALMLFRLGDEEVSATELRTRGYYLGSNPSYNVAKLVERGLLEHRRATGDKRCVRIKATAKGKAAANIVAVLFERHARNLAALGDVDSAELASLCATLRRLHGFLVEQVVYRQV